MLEPGHSQMIHIKDLIIAKAAHKIAALRKL
jgi:hypothetical protein